MPETEHTAPAPVTVPAYAAGHGTPDVALGRLREAGWTRYADGDCNITYISPDGAARAEFGPETRHAEYGVLWQVAYTDPDPYTKSPATWKATFGAQVPAEAIAAFLTALTDPEGLETER